MILTDVEHIDPEAEEMDYHGLGWPWVYSRPRNYLVVADHQIFHMDLFETMSESDDEEARLLSSNYLNSIRDNLVDYVIGRYDGNRDIGTISYKGMRDEEYAILEALQSVKSELDPREWNTGYGDSLAKVAEDVAKNRARGSWPRYYSWTTSWIYLPDIDQVLMSTQEMHSHPEVIEDWEEETGQQANLDQPYEVGVILQNDISRQYVIYPEYSDWARYNQGTDKVPLSEDRVLRMVKAKAEENGWPVTGVLRGDDYLGYGEDNPEGQVMTLAKFKPKKRKRHHVKKREHEGFHRYDGYALFIPEWFSPPVAPEGGQIDTTLGKVAAGVLVKFVSLPDKFLVGEDTHHLYLLEAEYGSGTFPADTGAIGRAWLENDMITGIGFDFGTASGQSYAVQQLTDWAEREGYQISPDLQLPIQGLANTA